jgi:hypothetical protein
MLAAAALLYAFLAPFLSSTVLDVPINSLRAVGPAITFLIVDHLSAPEERALQTPART